MVPTHLWSANTDTHRHTQRETTLHQDVCLYQDACLSSLQRRGSVTINSHRHARHDQTVLSVSRPLLRCELDSRQHKTVVDRKFDVWTRSEQSSNSHDADRTVLSCLAGSVNWALGCGCTYKIFKRSCCSTDSERPHSCCHFPNKVENVDRTPDISCTLQYAGRCPLKECAFPWDPNFGLIQ